MPNQALTHSANRKLTVSLIEHIGSIQQCVQAASVHQHCVAAHVTWSHELLLLQTLGPQAPTITLVIQKSDAIAPPISEHVQRWLEHVTPRDVLNKQRQARSLLTPIHRRHAQIDRDLCTRAHMDIVPGR
jgi:hypothetical protein